jgi:hypothetical protein
VAAVGSGGRETRTWKKSRVHTADKTIVVIDLSRLIATQWFIGIVAPFGDSRIRIDYSDNLPLNDLPGILLEIAEKVTDGEVHLHPAPKGEKPRGG